MRRRVRLSEGKLHKIIKESVKKVLNENIPVGISNGSGIKEIEQSILNAYKTFEKYSHLELPEEAIAEAKEEENVDLYEEMWRVYNYLENAMRSLYTVEYYMDIKADKTVYSIGTNY